jgi:hypothetical protein
MTVRQKLNFFNVYSEDYTKANFTVIKVETVGGRAMGSRHYFMNYEQLIGLFGFYECVSLKPNLYGSTYYIITVK